MILNILPSTATSSLQKARLPNILRIFKYFKRVQAIEITEKKKEKKTKVHYKVSATTLQGKLATQGTRQTPMGMIHATSSSEPLSLDFGKFLFQIF